MAISDIVPDLDLDFETDFADETATTASEGPLTGSRSGRGRARSSGDDSDGSTRKPRKPSKVRLSNLKTKLTEQMFMAGTMTGMALPVTGIYVCQESKNFCDAVVDLAESNATWIAALERLTLIEPGIIVGRTAFGIGGALAVDRGRAQPDTAVMKALGVYQAFLRLQDGGGSGDIEEGSSYSPPPRSFVPVA